MRSDQSARDTSERIRPPLQRYVEVSRHDTDILLAIKESVNDLTTPGLTRDEFLREYLGR